jgi:DNA-directed RNA polymerase sigma subunit (sigma70/sigma32)
MNPTYIRSDLVSSQDGTSRLKDFILGETSCDVPDAVIEEKAAAWLREAIGRLPQKARYVLVRRYGLDDRDPATLAELAADLNLSRERIRQLQREAEFLLDTVIRKVELARSIRAGVAGTPKQPIMNKKQNIYLTYC